MMLSFWIRSLVGTIGRGNGREVGVLVAGVEDGENRG